MDPIMLAALLAFAVLVIAWLILPAATVVAGESVEQPAVPGLYQDMAQVS